jgi:hypothetical protein
MWYQADGSLSRAVELVKLLPSNQVTALELIAMPEVPADQI